MGSTVRSKKMAVSELYGRLRFPSPSNPGLPGLYFILRKSGRPDLRFGGGLGRGVSCKVGACGYPPLQLSPARGERADCARSQRDDGFNFQTAKSQKVLRANGSRECAPRWLAMTANPDTASRPRDAMRPRR